MSKQKKLKSWSTNLFFSLNFVQTKGTNNLVKTNQISMLWIQTKGTKSWWKTWMQHLPLQPWPLNWMQNAADRNIFWGGVFFPLEEKMYFFRKSFLYIWEKKKKNVNILLVWSKFDNQQNRQQKTNLDSKGQK